MPILFLTSFSNAYFFELPLKPKTKRLKCIGIDILESFDIKKVSGPLGFLPQG